MKILLALALLWASTAVRAEDVPVTARAAVERALTQRAEMRREDAHIAAAAARLAVAEGAYWPTLAAYADMQHARTYDPYSGVEVTGDLAGTPIFVAVERVLVPYQAVAGLESVWNLYTGGADDARVHVARAELAAAHAQRELTRRALIVDAAAGYWALRKAQLQHTRAQTQAQHAAASARIAAAQWQAGRISALARERTELAALEAEHALRRSERVRDDRWQSYRSVLALPAGDMPALSDDPAQFDLAAILAALGIASPAHPLPAKLAAEVAAARARADVARAAHSPQLELFARAQAVGRDDAGFGGAWSDLKRQDEVVGARLRWNLFNGGQERARERAARAEATIAELRHEQGERDRAERARERATAVALAEDALALAEKRRELARGELAVARAERELAQITAVQFQAAELALAEAEEQLTFAHIERLLAQLAAALAPV